MLFEVHFVDHDNDPKSNTSTVQYMKIIQLQCIKVHNDTVLYNTIQYVKL